MEAAASATASQSHSSPGTPATLTPFVEADAGLGESLAASPLALGPTMDSEAMMDKEVESLDLDSLSADAEVTEREDFAPESKKDK